MNALLIVMAILSTGGLEVHTQEYDTLRDCWTAKVNLQRMLTEIDNASGYSSVTTNCIIPESI